MLVESPPGTGRLVSFRLADVPLELRRRAAKRLRRDAGEDGLDGLLEATRLTQAALAPSDTVYWIGEQAWRSVIG